MNSFILPQWIKSSPYPAGFVPAGATVIDMASGDDECYTVKGFYEPISGEYHIQELERSR